MAVTGLGKRRVKMTAQGDSIPGRWKVRTFRWLGATTAGHVLVVNDTNGNLIWESESDGPNFNDLHPLYDWVDGIVVQTMPSGRILVYLD